MRDNKGCLVQFLMVLVCIILYAILWEYVANSDMPDWMKVVILS